MIDILDSSFIVACLFYGVFDSLSHYLPKFTHEMKADISSPLFVSRYVSTIHSIITSSLAIFYISGLLPFEIWKALRCIPIGYYIYDAFIFYGNTDLYLKGDFYIPLHHLVSVISGLYLIDSYPLEVGYGFLAELSDPFLHASYHFFHTSHGKIYPRLFIFSSWMTIIIFLCFRVGVFGWMLWEVFWMERAWLAKICVAVLSVLNFIWFKRLSCRTFGPGLSLSSE